MVESVRIGTVIASNRRAASQWQRHAPTAVRQRGLTGAALEEAVGRIGELFPGHVIREVRPAA